MEYKINFSVAFVTLTEFGKIELELSDRTEAFISSKYLNVDIISIFSLVLQVKSFEKIILTSYGIT